MPRRGMLIPNAYGGIFDIVSVVTHECIRITLFSSHILASVTIIKSSCMLQKYPSYSNSVSNSSSASIKSSLLMTFIIAYFLKTSFPCGHAPTSQLAH